MPDIKKFKHDYPTKWDDTLTRLEWHILQPKSVKLTRKERRYYRQLKTAWAVLMDEPQPFKARRVLENLYGITDKQAYNNIRDAQTLFGQVEKPHIEGMRAILTNQTLEVMSRAKEAGDLDTWVRAIREAKSIQNLDKDQTKELSKYKSVELKVSMDSKQMDAIKQLAKKGFIDLDEEHPDIQDIEYKEVDEQGTDSTD